MNKFEDRYTVIEQSLILIECLLQYKFIKYFNITITIHFKLWLICDSLRSMLELYSFNLFVNMQNIRMLNFDICFIPNGKAAELRYSSV